MTEVSKPERDAKFIENAPEIFRSAPDNRAKVSYAHKTGKIRQVTRSLYTKDLTTPLDTYVKRNITRIIGLLYNDAMLDGRTALEMQPAEDGSVFIIAAQGGTTTLPGHTIYPRRAAPPLVSDTRMSNGTYIPSTARALIENMPQTRASKNRTGRNYRQDEIEQYLDKYIERYGQDAVNKLRDEVRQIGNELAMSQEADALGKLIGSLLGTKNAPLTSLAGKRRKSGKPVDLERMALFETLFKALHEYQPMDRPDPADKADRYELLTFYEAYFSNFIEGTEFAVSEAREIVFNKVIPTDRPDDAHDVMGTWQVVTDARGMTTPPLSVEAFIDQLRNDHRKVMSAHPNKHPGSFKQEPNKAGNSFFVAPEKAVGTLEEGFSILDRLKGGFRRGVFAMFLISEVHPFADGNGRTARIAMNRELSSDGQARIIVPTVYRNNYLNALKTMSHSGNTTAMIRMLAFAQQWTYEVAWGEWQDTYDILEASNAFLDAHFADDKGLRLERPL